MVRKYYMVGALTPSQSNRSNVGRWSGQVEIFMKQICLIGQTENKERKCKFVRKQISRPSNFIWREGGWMLRCNICRPFHFTTRTLWVCAGTTLIFARKSGYGLLAPSGALIAIPTYYWSTPPPAPPLFQITPVLNTGLSLSEPLQLYKGYNAI